jgi:organic radical activating enzyme
MTTIEHRAPHKPQLRDSYPMLGLVSSAFPYRIPGDRYGKYGSLVMVAPCNMACPYCDVGGYAKDERHYLPDWKEISLREIEDFVQAEVLAGRLIYFTGGEPLMFPELVVHLGKLVRHLGGYSIVCTNASLSGRIELVSPFVDEFSVSLKGTPRIAEAVSGLRGRTAFDVPHRNTLGIAELPNRLELVVVLFDGMEFDDVVDLYGPLFGRAHFAFKEYRHKATVAHTDHTYTSTLLDLGDDSAVRPMPRTRARELFQRLVDSFPRHADGFTLILGGGGQQTVVTANKEEVIQR